MNKEGTVLIDEQRIIRPEPLPPPRAPLPPLRRASDRAPFEEPAFAAAVNAAYDHVVDHKVPGLGYADTEAICRLFLVHFLALGGRL